MTDRLRPSIWNAVRALATGLAAVAIVAGCSSGGSASAIPSVSSEPASAAPSAATGGTGAGGCPTSQPPALAQGEKHVVRIETKLGNIEVTVDGSLSPIAAGNFVALARCGFYDGVVFHRAARLQDGTPFVIQGGDGEFGRAPNIDPQRVGSGGPGYEITDEPVTATYAVGAVAMARTSAPNSQGSQFFVVLDAKATEILAAYNTYAIFGNVTAGMDVADKIMAAADGEMPTNPVVMDKVVVDPQ